MKTTWRPGRWLIILPPLLFLLIFFLIPFAFAFKISFAEAAPQVPPFTDVFSFTREHGLQLSLSLGNYRYLLFDCYVTELYDNWGNTFYSEIDVVRK